MITAKTWRSEALISNDLKVSVVFPDFVNTTATSLYWSPQEKKKAWYRHNFVSQSFRTDNNQIKRSTWKFEIWSKTAS